MVDEENKEEIPSIDERLEKDNEDWEKIEKERIEKEREKIYTPNREIWKAMPEPTKAIMRTMCEDVDNLEQRVFEVMEVKILSAATCPDSLQPLVEAVEELVSLDPQYISWNYGDDREYPDKYSNPLCDLKERDGLHDIDNIDKYPETPPNKRYTIWKKPVNLSFSTYHTAPKEAIKGNESLSIKNNMHFIRMGIMHSFTELNINTERIKIERLNMGRPMPEGISYDDALKIMLPFTNIHAHLIKNVQEICKKLTASARGDVICSIRREYACDNYYYGRHTKVFEGIDEDDVVVHGGFAVAPSYTKKVYAYDRKKGKVVEIDVEINFPFLERLVLNSIKIKGKGAKRISEKFIKKAKRYLLRSFDRYGKNQYFKNIFYPALTSRVGWHMKGEIEDIVWEEYGGSAKCD